MIAAAAGAGVIETRTVAPALTCRRGCAACCIAPSISSSIPGMPEGKPAGVRCVQLTEDHRCRLFGRSERPEVCHRLRPSPEMCGRDGAEAMALLTELERANKLNKGRFEFLVLGFALTASQNQ
jgi:Fe-S-cluster containining protein